MIFTRHNAFVFCDKTNLKLSLMKTSICLYRYITFWYIAPLPIQKLLLFILTSVKDHKLLIGGVYVPSIEGFSSVIIDTMYKYTLIKIIGI